MSPLFIPGPVDVDPEVLDAQTQAMLPHRSSEFEEIFHRAEGKARKVFYTENRVFIMASSGTGLQEAAVRNFANARVLNCANGAFGNRWHDVTLNNGKKADKLDVSWENRSCQNWLLTHLRRERTKSSRLYIMKHPQVCRTR